MPQPTFFDAEPEPSPPWVEDDSALVRIAGVVFASSGPPGVFDYLVPDGFADLLLPGMRLNVPLGKSNRSVLAYCITHEIRSIPDPATRKRLKSVQSLVDFKSLLSEKLIRLAEWISEYYLCPLGQVMEAILPSGVRAKAGTRIVKVFQINEDLLQQITQTSQNTKNGPKVTQKQFQVLNVVRNSSEAMTQIELQRAAKCSPAPIDALKKLDILKLSQLRRETEIEHITRTEVEKNPGHALNPDQHKTLDVFLKGLRSGKHSTYLLHGVTGSGKTEIYIRAIEETVKYGRQAIVLVPEISLTPQTVSRFAGRFPEIAVLHSHLTEAQRHREWTRIAEGRVQVVVGARSAIFAPVPRLGLIVIDEEHENSFKQDTAPRYHAREVARKRAENENIPLILGSATPSLESWHDVEIGKSEYVGMPNRVLGRSLPVVDTIDMRDRDLVRSTRGAIHFPLYMAMKDSLESGGQVILLLNRRGFSTHIQCPACGEVVKCPHCDISLTHHRLENIALCHYCDHQEPTTDRCPACGFVGIRYSGLGTQKLEMEISSRFPNYPSLRMDTDTMQGRGAHERALARFRSGEIKILFGTQMIAKGLDFPNVTLVGVINADTALHLPDFRAAERTFHLVTQVAGRTGRGEKGGRVLVQTYKPDNPAIDAAREHDYLRFVEGELPFRKEHGYPPYTKMARFLVRGPDEKKAEAFGRTIGDSLRGSAEKLGFAKNVRVLGPAVAPIAKLRNLFRFHLHFHAPDEATLHEVVRPVISTVKNPDKEIQWILDIDPVDML